MVDLNLDRNKKSHLFFWFHWNVLKILIPWYALSVDCSNANVDNTTFFNLTVFLIILQLGEDKRWCNRSNSPVLFLFQLFPFTYVEHILFLINLYCQLSISFLFLCFWLRHGADLFFKFGCNWDFPIITIFSNTFDADMIRVSEFPYSVVFSSICSKCYYRALSFISYNHGELLKFVSFPLSFG